MGFNKSTSSKDFMLVLLNNYLIDHVEEIGR